MTASLWFAIICYVLAIIQFIILFDIVNDYESLFFISVVIGVVGSIIFFPIVISTLLCGNTSLEDITTFITRVHRGVNND